MLKNLDNVERIEVLKGSASTLYGSDAKGGVINIITAKPEGIKTKISAELGSFNTENYAINHQEKKKIGLGMLMSVKIKSVILRTDAE